MASGWVFFVKELREILRTSKLYVLPGLFLFFGLTSPILTKLTPALIERLSAAGPGGPIQISIPTPTAVDSFLQFFKNLTQLGTLALILTSMGAVSREKSRGTALLVVAKPVSRTAMVVSKFASGVLLVVFATVLGYGANLLYTLVLFEGTPVAATAAATAVYLVYATFLLALTISASAVTRGQLASAGIALAGLFVVSILPAFGGWPARWTPGGLTGFVTRVLSGAATLRDALPAMSVSLVLSALLVAAGSRVFDRQEL